MSPDLEKRLIAISNSNRGLPFIVTMLERGDFHDPTERAEVSAWVKKEAKRRRKAYLLTSEGSAIRQADAAGRAVAISWLALIVSALALWQSWK